MSNTAIAETITLDLMTSASPWYAVRNIADVDSPALLVFPERVQANIQTMLRMAGGPDRLHPHVKTHKMSEVTRMQMAAGIRQFKCATIAEAEMIAATGSAEILVAHQPVGPKLQRFVRLVAAFPGSRFATIIDNLHSAHELSHAITAAGKQVEVWIDVDNGMGRCGTPPTAAAAELYSQVSGLPNLRAVGLHVYDGHIRNSNLAERTAASDAAFVMVDKLRDDIASLGHPRPRVIAGGTPTFPVHARHADRELSPGTCVFWDASYGQQFSDMPFEPAAIVVTRVISKPANDRLCVDLGHKSVAADPAGPRVAWLDLPDAKTLVHSEEHLTISTQHAPQYSVGDVLYGVPMHICPTCALYPEAVIVRDGHTVGAWKVDARNRVITV